MKGRLAAAAIFLSAALLIAPSLPRYAITTYRHTLALPGPAGDHIARLEKAGDALWVATFDGGLSCFRKGLWSHWSVSSGLPSDWIDDIRWDGKKLWGAGEKGIFWIEDGKVVRPQGEVFRQ